MVAPQNVVELRDVSRHYTSRSETVRALNGVSLRVAPGELVAIAGPSGSGKSTLLHLVGALDRPGEGAVVLEGKDLTRLPESALSLLRRDRIGFVFQAYNLVPVMSVLENVEYVMWIQGVKKKERRERASHALEQVGLGDKLHRRPNELSGGQQQRVAVARAIAPKPALVLADEPTANLDSKTGDALVEMMVDLNRRLGTTFIFSTHDPRVMAAASRRVTLHDGRVEADERR